MVLRGVLDVSFNNYVCIRGFAPLKDLAKHSKIDLKYQRQPDDKHVREIAAFIKQKEYHYYPEILLGMPCDRFKYIEKTRKMVDKAIPGGFKHYMEVVSHEISLYNVLRSMVLGDMSQHHDNEVERLDLGRMKPRHESDPAKCRFYGRHFGNLKVSVGQRKNYLDRNERVCRVNGEDVQYLFLNVSIYDFEKVEGGSPIYCIDGNHRLEVARRDENVGNYLVPFCLMLFEDEDSCREHGAMLFHNINYHALQVSDERNARTIVEHKKADGDYLFSDERLLSFPSLGRGEYFFVRKTWDALCKEYEKFHDPDECRVSELFESDLFKEIFSENVDGQSVGALTFLLSILKVLFDQMGKNGTEVSKEITKLVETRLEQDQDGDASTLSEDYKMGVDGFVGKFVDSMHEADKLVCKRGDLKSENQNSAIAAALVALAFYEDKRYQSYFLDYVVKRRWGCVKDLAVSEVMSLFKEQMDRKKRTIFVSMPFHRYACDYHYQVIEEVVEEINKQYAEQLGDVLLDCHRVDRNEAGKTFEINQKVADAIAECGLLIADLTYSNVNVFHEVGMLMGRAFAQQGHTNEFDMILLCDESESSVNEVEYNLHSLQMVCFKQPTELKDQLKDRLLNFYKLKQS